MTHCHSALPSLIDGPGTVSLGGNRSIKPNSEEAAEAGCIVVGKKNSKMFPLSCIAEKEQLAASSAIFGNYNFTQSAICTLVTQKAEPISYHAIHSTRPEIGQLVLKQDGGYMKLHKVRKQVNKPACLVRNWASVLVNGQLPSHAMCSVRECTQGFN